MASFYEVLTAAVKDFSDNGYDSQERLSYWMQKIRDAAVDSLVPEAQLQKYVAAVMVRDYTRLVDRGEILKRHPGVSRFTLDQVKPKLRAELDRRIMANAELIKINRQAAIEKTLQRFSGWSTSISAGGSKAVDKPEVKTDIRKALAQLPFQERRVAIDQGHKMIDAINNIIAVDAGSIAARWHSHYRQAGYNYREDHKDRDDKIYAIKGNWALEKGLMNAGPNGYTEDITKPGEEVFCRCFYTYIYSPSLLPDDMLTEKGRQSIKDARAKIAAMK